MIRFLLPPLLLLSVISLGCNNPPAAAAPEPPTVPVAMPLQKKIVEWNEFTGRLQAVNFVEVRSRVGGYLDEVHFSEGQDVEKDALLFTVDQRPFQTELKQAEAALKEAEARVEQAKAQRTQAMAQKESAQSTLNLAETEFARIEKLRKSNTISQSEFESARSELQQAQANLEAASAGIIGAEAAIATAEAAVETAKAAVAAAKLNLEYTEIKAPVKGRISRLYVTKGNLISGGTEQSTLLTTIVSLEPIYFVFDASEQQVLRFQRMVQAGTQRSARDVQYPAYLALADETGYPHQGVIDFVDNRLDPNTATLTARAVFSNKNAFLTPGMFGKLRVPASPEYEAILLPDAAIGADQAESFVYVVDQENTVQRKIVETGSLALGMRVIRSGISADDRVIVGGLQQVRPGMVVQTKESTLSAEEAELAQYKSTPLENP